MSVLNIFSSITQIFRIHQNDVRELASCIPCCRNSMLQQPQNVLNTFPSNLLRTIKIKINPPKFRHNNCSPKKVPQISRFDEFEKLHCITNPKHMDVVLLQTVALSNFLDCQDVLWIPRWFENRYTLIHVKVHSQGKIDSNFSLSPFQNKHQIELFWKSFSQIRNPLWKYFFQKRNNCSRSNYQYGRLTKNGFFFPFFQNHEVVVQDPEFNLLSKKIRHTQRWKFQLHRPKSHVFNFPKIHRKENSPKKVKLHFIEEMC